MKTITVELTTQEVSVLVRALLSDEVDRDVCQPKFADRVKRAAELLGMVGR